MIQKHVKGWLQRKRYRKITKSVCLLQKYGRGLLARRFVHLCKPIFSSPDKRPCELLQSFGIHRHPSVHLQTDFVIFLYLLRCSQPLTCFCIMMPHCRNLSDLSFSRYATCPARKNILVLPNLYLSSFTFMISIFDAMIACFCYYLPS
jgi:hypothetical protein